MVTSRTWYIFEFDQLKKNNGIIIIFLPINDRKCCLVGLCLRAATPIHVWFPIHHYQIQCEDDDERDQRSHPINEEHYGHARNKTEQRQPGVVIL